MGDVSPATYAQRGMGGCKPSNIRTEGKGAARQATYAQMGKGCKPSSNICTEWKGLQARQNMHRWEGAVSQTTYAQSEGSDGKAASKAKQ